MFINIIIAVAILAVLILVHEMGHFIAARFFKMRVNEFGIGFPPRLWSKKKGDTLYSINAIPLGGFVSIAGEDGSDEKEKDGGRFDKKPIWQRAIVLCAGVVMNFLLGWLLLIPVLSVGTSSMLVISQIAPNSPAAVAEFMDGDIIIEYDSSDAFISFIDEHRGQEIEVVVNRAGEELVISATPRANPPVGEGALGVGLIEGQIESYPVWRAVWEALKTALYLFSFIFIFLFKLIVSIVGGGDLFSQIAGPVGIYKITTQAAGLGWIYLLNLIALISLNLAALNIFPFPALDGGRLVFLGIEKVQKKPVRAEIQQWVNGGAFILLILLMLAVTIQDIGRFF